MDLVIKQNVNQQENGNSALLDLLYNLTKPDPATGQAIIDNAILIGRISVPAAYEDAVSFLNTHFSAERDNGSDFQVFVLNSNFYIRFVDPNVLSILLNAGFGNGTGITTSEAATANISNTFKNNTSIVSFDEFKYFTAQQGRATSFQVCTSLERIDISDCTNIGSNMFNGCSNLEYFHGANSVQGALIIPTGISTIGPFAFRYCTGITTLTLHGDMTVGDRAFEYCSNLNAVYIDSLDDWLSITFVTDQPLNKAHNLYINGSLVNNVTIPAGTDLANKFWGSTSLTSVTLEDGITSIGGNAFNGCSSLAFVTIGNSVTSIGNSAFQNCSGLTSVVIPNAVTSIGISAFNGCKNLTHISIPDSVTTLNYDSFRNCDGLLTVEFGTGIQNIGATAFYNNWNIQYMIFHATTPPDINNNSPLGTAGQAFPIYVLDEYVNTYKQKENWSNLYAGRIKPMSEFPNS